MSQISRLEALKEHNSQVKNDSLVYKRIKTLFDEGTFTELNSLAKFKEKQVGVVTGYGMVNGATVFAFCQDSDVDGGAVSVAGCAKIKKVYEMAAKVGVPVVGIYDSVGARLCEGADVLNAYGELLNAAGNISGVVPHISVVAGVCAGSAAVLAASADVVLMNKNGEFFLTAPFVTNAMGEKVEGAGSAENALKSGVVSLVEENCLVAIEKARDIISMLPLNNLSEAPYTEYTEVDCSGLNALADNADAYKAADVIATVFDHESAVVLGEGFGDSAITALATLGGQAVGVVATVDRLDKDACSKIAKFVSVCDSFSVPVVTLVDCEGFKESAADELAGSVRDAARVANVYANATCPKVSVITKNAVGSAYVALASKNAGADMTIAWPCAYIAPVSAEAAVSIMHADEVAAAEDKAACKANLIASYKAESVFNAANSGAVDAVIEPAATRSALLNAMDMLAGKRVSNLPKKHGNMPL